MFKPGHKCHGNQSTERSHGEGQGSEHTRPCVYYCKCEDLLLAALIPWKLRWSWLPRMLDQDIRISAMSLSFWGYLIHMQKHSQASLFNFTNRRCTVCTAVNLFECTWVWPCGVYECAPRAHLAELRCTGSSCGLSSGGHPCPLQDALISFKPGGLSGAQWPVPK